MVVIRFYLLMHVIGVPRPDLKRAGLWLPCGAGLRAGARWPEQVAEKRVLLSFRALRSHPERSEEPVLNEVKESRSGRSG